MPRNTTRPHHKKGDGTPVAGVGRDQHAVRDSRLIPHEEAVVAQDVLGAPISARAARGWGTLFLIGESIISGRIDVALQMFLS